MLFLPKLSIMSRNIKFLVNRSEITAGTRGASLGPEAVMTAARKEGSLLFGQYDKVFLKDRNDLLDQPIKFPYAKRIEGLVEVFEEVSSIVCDVIKEGGFPLVMAGDHGSAGGTIAGVKKAYPNKRLGVVWIDAHGDLHTPFTTPSGNMHGMPLATALGEDNTPCKKNEISEHEQALWEQLKNTGVDGPKVDPVDLVFVAVRDTEEQEDALMERLNIKNHSVHDVRSEGVEHILSEIKDQLSECDVIYVSFDVDSMDPEYTSHGTGTPVEDGLTPAEASLLLRGLAKMDKTACIEFVEVNPCLDEKTNRMAEATYEILEDVLNELK